MVREDWVRHYLTTEERRVDQRFTEVDTEALAHSERIEINTARLNRVRLLLTISLLWNLAITVLFVIAVL